MGADPPVERTLYSVAVELRRSLPPASISEQIDEDIIDAAERRLPPAPVKVPPPLDEVVVAELSEREKSEDRLR